MSTPTTTTATLPPPHSRYHHQLDHHPHPHRQHYRAPSFHRIPSPSSAAGASGQGGLPVAHLPGSPAPRPPPHKHHYYSHYGPDHANDRQPQSHHHNLNHDHAGASTGSRPANLHYNHESGGTRRQHHQHHADYDENHSQDRERGYANSQGFGRNTARENQTSTSHTFAASSAKSPGGSSNNNTTTTTTTHAADSNMPPTMTQSMASSTTLTDSQSRKRRRSREPDWNNFYRNGLPKEIIVIDDSPEPQAAVNGRKLANGHRAIPGSAATHVASAMDESSARHPAKKRRREGQPGGHSQGGYHVEFTGSQQNSTPNGSAHSSDRTNSALHTTAPTSLSSNGQYDDAQTTLKRKRTRQQLASEAKRREVDGFGDQGYTYKPPEHPKKQSDVHVRVVHDRHHSKSIKVDDDDGHYIVVPDSDLTEQYQISRLLGQGTFGKVVQARDRKRNKAVAIKIIRSVQKYRDASRIELRVLATLKANDAANRNRCIHLKDCFDYRGHICIVMDLLGQSVFDFLKGNGFVPFPNSQIQSFARQLLTSVAFLHDLNLIHTDLKPENILLCDNGYQTFTYNRKIPSSSTTINRQATQRRVLLDTEIRLIDFGSATFQDEYHSSVVSTRHYRAPEIILGLGWSYPCDIWSIGCILVEFYTGDALFQTHDNLEHLAMMEAINGTRIDSHLVQAVNRMASRSSGNPASKYFKRLKLDYPTTDTTRGSRRFVKAMKHLDDIIPPNNTFLKNFLDLLRKIFVYDPAQRITAKQALNHPWFKEMAQPDDGTEAAKIRLERRRVEQDSGRQYAQYVG